MAASLSESQSGEEEDDVEIPACAIAEDRAAGRSGLEFRSKNPGLPESLAGISEHDGRSVNHPAIPRVPDSRPPHGNLHYRTIPYQDQLEKTLAPLNPRVFEVKSPGDFRKVIASILAEAGKR